MAQGFVLVKKNLSPTSRQVHTGTHVEGKLGVPVVGF